MTLAPLAAKAAFAVPLAALSSVLGIGGYPVIFFIVVALIDWITGTMKALKSGNWASAVARGGLWHKTGEFISLLVAAGLDILIYCISANLPALGINYKAFLLPVVSVWYICTELGSILENIGELGAPVPAFLRRAISLLREKAEESGEEEAELREVIK